MVDLTLKGLKVPQARLSLFRQNDPANVGFELGLVLKSHNTNVKLEYRGVYRVSPRRFVVGQELDLVIIISKYDQSACVI